MNKGFQVLQWYHLTLNRCLLTETIDIILDRVYSRKEISTVFTKNEMKNLLIRCTKYMNKETYVHIDEVALALLFNTPFSKCFYSRT